MKLFEHAGFPGRGLATLIAGALMISAAWADGGYEQSGKNIMVTGNAAITVTNVEFEIDVASGGNASVDAAYPVTVRAQAGGSVTLRGDAWQNKVGLWLDASEEWTLEATTNSSGAVQSIYDNDVNKRGAYITRWRDRRPEQTEWIGYNNRYVGVATPNWGVLPYVVSNGCNGLTYVTTGNQAQYGRRLPFIKVVDGVEMGDMTGAGVGTGTYHPSYVMDVKYVIMVFGSQRGGGQTVAGDLARATTSGTVAADAGLFSTSRPARIDGEAIDPTTTGMNGGWQILSFATISGDKVNGLSGTISNTQYGGQNYAEVLVFTNMPTSYEIASVERHLAAKWGIATYSASDTVGETRLYGEGSVSVESGEVLFGGEFSGTVSVATDATLRLADTALAPTNPAAGMHGWWDPDRADKLTTSAATVDGVTVQRVSTMNNLAGSYSGKANNLVGSGRGPRVKSDVRGWGTAVHSWCDYKTAYTGGTGNTLRLNDATDGTANCLPTRTGFMVLDTSEGAGTPFLDTSIYSFNGSLNSLYVMARVATAPIFRTQTGTAAFNPAEDAYVVTNSPAYLDGMAVNSGKRGYNSRTELLSFTFSKEIPVRCFGAWQQGQGYDGSLGLRHGEIILYPTALSDADRKATEAYLMKKWLGKTPSGYGDPSQMTVTGAGMVKTANGAMRPKTDAGFTGTLSIEDPTLVFTLDASAVSTVTDAISLLGGTLATAGTLTINLKFIGCPQPGLYSLVEANSWNAATVAIGNISGISGKKADRLRLTRSGNSLLLRINEVGTSLLFR